MFRNGLSAGRRSVRVSACIPTPAISSGIGPSRNSKIPTFQPELPTVCLSCQVRAYAKPRKTKSPLLASVERLERHVQMLETKYKDYVNRETVKAESPSIEITDEMQDTAYAALMAPESQVTSFLLPAVPVLPQIPGTVVPRLGTTALALRVEENPQWGLVLKEIRGNGGFKDIDIKDVNKTLFLVPDDQRADLTDTILSMLDESGTAANAFTYDLLMMANTAKGNVKVAQDLYIRLKEAGLKPTLRIYAHLLKAFSQTRDVAAASQAFQEMHLAGIKPNLIVYTSLIKTCINREELDIAWQIFDLIKYRSTETAPDVTTYGLMIHACAMRGEAEKALDIFRHMTETRGIQPDEKAYNSLIHALAVRKDYFLEAWKYSIEMRQKGMKVGRWTLNHLLQACGKTGDLTRARLLMRLMMSSDNPEFQPDERSFQGLFRAYATAKWKPGARKTMSQEAFLIPNSNKSNIGNTNSNNNIGCVDQEDLDRLPFLENSVLATRTQILAEAKQLLRYITEYKPSFYSAKILNAYLDVCFNQYGHLEFRKVYLGYFSSLDPSMDADYDDSEYSGFTTNDTSDTSPDEPSKDEPPTSIKPYRNIFTFEIALEYARRQGALPFARKVWADRMRYCETSEYWNLLHPIRRRLDFTAEKLMVQTMAKAGALREALDRLKVLQYEYEWTKADLKPLYDKAREREDMGAVSELRAILKLDDRVW